MAVIKSGSTADLLAVEPGGAARAVLYGPTGAPISSTAPLPVREFSADQGPSYSVSFDLAPTTLSDATTYFALFNTSAFLVHVRRISFAQGFIGISALSRSTFRIERFTGTPTGGTAVSTSRKDSLTAVSGCTAITSPSGLSTTGLTFEAGGFYRAAYPNQLAAAIAQEIDVGTREAAAIALQPGQGLAVRAAGTIVAGAYLVGSFGYHEHSTS